MGNRSEMTKLAAYKRLCKLASAARVAKYNSMLLKYAGKDKKKSKKIEQGFLDIGVPGLITTATEGIDPLEMTPEAKAEAVKKLKHMATMGYVGAGVAPGVTTLAGTGIGYGLGRIFGRRAGGIGAAIGGGLGLGLGTIPGAGFGIGGAMAGRAAHRLETGTYDKDMLTAQLKLRAEAEAERKRKREERKLSKTKPPKE